LAIRGNQKGRGAATASAAIKEAANPREDLRRIKANLQARCSAGLISIAENRCHQITHANDSKGAHDQQDEIG
jgi:hypothetical protein